MNADQSTIPVLGREQTFLALGKAWTLGRLDFDVFEGFFQWALPQIPDPIDGLDRLIAHLPPDVAQRLVLDALEVRRRVKDWNSPEIKALRDTDRGKMYTFYLMLKVKHPETTEKEAFEVAMAIGPDDLARKFKIAAGKAQPEGKAQALAG